MNYYISVMFSEERLISSLLQFQFFSQKRLIWFQVAKKMATGWLRVSYQLFIRTHAMFEKYNVTIHSDEVHAGSGGEYEVQVCFIIFFIFNQHLIPGGLFFFI